MSRNGGLGEDPLFTDFTTSNIGTPANPRLPYYVEQRPDALGYVANPAGSSFVDGGVGNFLTKGHLLSQPSAVRFAMAQVAPDNQARFRVPALRNMDRRPSPTFVKAYGHNGYFTSPEVHRAFLQDVGRPAALPAERLRRRSVGRRGGCARELHATLTDGFMLPDQR
jgi:cytochrome c peroxidase